MTCADSVANPQIIINPQVLINGTLSCAAGMSLSGGDLMVWSKITTPYVGSATDLQLYPTGNVRVMGNKTLFCNAISQNDTNTDLYLTAGGTNQNVVLSPAGTGQVQVLTGKTLSADNIVSKGLSVNGNVIAAKLQPYDTAGLVIDLNACTMTCTDAVPNPQIIMSSPVLANILTVNTIKSADATNLTINSPGGTINTNATNITASGALALNSTNSRLTLNAGTNIVYVSSPTTFNNSIACSSFSNGVNNNIVMTPLTGTITLSTNNANNIFINPGTTAITSFGGGGIQLPNGSTTFNWYDVNRNMVKYYYTCCNIYCIYS